MSDFDDDADVLAAEYVLGTLDGAERASVGVRRAADASLARAIEAWEARLGPLAAAAPDVAAPDHVYPSLMTRLFPVPRSAEVTDLDAVRARLRNWRAATAACAALAAALLVWIGVAPHAGPGRGLVAVLQQDAAAPAIVVEIDVDARELSVRPFTADLPAGRMYELWIIAPALGAPRSLGTLSQGRSVSASLSGLDPGVIREATYAVTIEPAGGAPGGKPSGKPVLLGTPRSDRS